jgi:hypothetical protein
MADKTTFGEPKNQHMTKLSFSPSRRRARTPWNTWRRDPANKDVRVTYVGIDFSKAPKDEIDFSWFEFGDNIFRGAGGGASRSGSSRYLYVRPRQFRWRSLRIWGQLYRRSIR